MNRLLLHGARYHDRKAVFVSRDLGETPDWRADRLSIRVALALRQDLAVGPGDLVALLGRVSERGHRWSEAIRLQVLDGKPAFTKAQGQ